MEFFKVPSATILLRRMMGLGMWRTGDHTGRAKGILVACPGKRGWCLDLLLNNCRDMSDASTPEHAKAPAEAG
jgi:hypothetical protein